MKRKFLLALTTIAMMVVSVIAVVGCADPEDKNQPETTQITVTYYHNTTELKSVTINKGEKAENYTPSKDGYEFMGWYSEISCAAGNEFNFDQALNENTDIFASFRENAYVADTNVYYAVGTGSGDMKVSNWNEKEGAPQLTFAKDETQTDKNVFTLQLKLFAGDQLQVCYGGSWNGQMGIGKFKGATLNEGVDPSDAHYVTAKNADGTVVFCGSKGFGDSPNGWNAVLAEGQDGIYKLTLTTYKDASYNEITWELVEKIEPLAQTHQMYLVGTLDVEGDVSTWYDNSEKNQMKESEDKSYWTAVITITEANFPSWGDGEHAELKVKNAISGQDYGVEGGNIKLAPGTYTIKYTVADNSIDVKEAKYYIVGTLLDGTAEVNFCVKEGVNPELTVDGDTATVTFTAVDATSSAGYSWIKDQGKPGVCAIKVVYGTEHTIIDWHSDDANGGDNFYLSAGEHTVTLNISTGEVTVA